MAYSADELLLPPIVFLDSRCTFFYEHDHTRFVSWTSNFRCSFSLLLSRFHIFGIGQSIQMHHRSYRFLFCISFQSVSVKSNSLCAPAFFHGVQFLPQCLIYWCLRGGIQRGIIGSAGYLCDSHLRGDICLRLLRKPYPVMSLATP